MVNLDSPSSLNLQELYEIDDNLWLEETIELLKAKKFDQLDLDNLIEELESLSKRDKLAVRSLLEQIIRHLLLLQYWEAEYEYNYRHWKAEVIGFRTQLNDRMTSNFYNYLTAEKERIYKNALKYVQQKTELDSFPQDCPYALEELLNEDWFPNQS